MVNDLPCLAFAAFHLEGEDASTAIGEELLIKGVVGMRGEGGMVDAGEVRMIGKKLK